MPDATLSIGEVARRTGLTVHALRFYERRGLLIRPVRRVGGKRVYTEVDVEWLELCLVLRASGMPLSALKTYTTLVRRGQGTEQQRLELLKEHQRRVAAQMQKLERCMDLVSYKVGIYEDIIAGQGDGECSIGDEARQSS
jgi:DNA-binding transcriptional MerR regulator